MARVTVEDCLKNVKNRFELVLLASKRARQLMRGKEPKVDIDNDKSTVIALREIAAGFTDFESHEVREEETTFILHHSLQEKAEDKPEENTEDTTPLSSSDSANPASES